MTNDELKAHWAENITSYEQFNAVLQRTRDHLPRSALGGNYSYLLPSNAQGVAVRHGNEHAWPLWRDQIREQIGFYPEPTSIIKWMRDISANMGAGQMFPHVSPINRMEIAFTPDGTQGKADRKQRMTSGRFLRKFLMYAPDAEIQRLDQLHRSELDTEFLLAETVEAIYTVYREMKGDTGCMRYDKDHFGLDDWHPSAVYASPGMGVAYTQDEDGEIKSRSVIWTNPEDAKDKRYVRIYGDPILKKKLEANGFRMAGLAGAKLRIYQESDWSNANKVVMPWIDPAGGIHERNVDRTLDGEHAIRFKGEEFFTIVDRATQARYAQAGIHLPNVQTQSGYVEVPEVDPSTFIFDCPITGRRTNRMQDATVLWIDANGAILRASKVGVDGKQGLHILHVQVESQLQRAYCTKDVFDTHHIPGFLHHFNDEATREALGLCMLDKAFYPDSERYFSRMDCVFIEDALNVRTFIKKVDCLMLYSEAGDKFIHIEMVRPMKKEGCVPVAVYNGYRGLAHKDHPKLAVTRGGKRVLIDHHDVMQLRDGQWEYRRNCESINVAGVTLNMHKDDDKFKLVVDTEQVMRAYKGIFELARRDGNDERRVSRMLRALTQGFQGGQTFMKSEASDNLVACNYYNKPTKVMHLVDAARGILVMKEDQEWMRRTLGYNWPHVLPWARTVVTIVEAMQAYDREYEMMMAEAHAVEAAPTTQAVIEKLNTLADADMDRLVSEVDETLATAVVRRWPRLQAAAQTIQQPPPMIPEQPVEMLTPVPDAPNFVVVHPDQINQTLHDDDLLAQLASAGLSPIVIDETTVFPHLPHREEA